MKSKLPTDYKKDDDDPREENTRQKETNNLASHFSIASLLTQLIRDIVQNI